MPRKIDFSVTPAGAIIRAYRARPVSDVTLPAPLTVIGHTRLSAYAPVVTQPVAVH